jgi:branched-chain amino acid transport system substrate-binding protein
LVADAITRGGATRETLRDALAQTRDFSGITGTISFSPKGDAEYRGISIVMVRGGKFVPYDGSTK